jgi:hypothetical protein
VRYTGRTWIPFFAVLSLSIAASKTVAGNAWPQDYIVHEGSESANGRYAVPVLSKQAAIDQNQTEGNTTYLANIETWQVLGEIRGTDYSKAKTIATSKSSGRLQRCSFCSGF